MAFVLLFFLGASLASFSLVFVERVLKGESIHGRSRCDACKMILRSWHLIPVLSFLLLRGKCGHCKRRISLWHVLSEIALGLCFAFAVVFTPEIGPSDIFIRLFILSVFFVLFIFDVRYGFITDLIVVPGFLFVLFYQLLSGSSLWVLLGSALMGALFFAVQYLLSKGKWVGAGDIRLGAFAGLVLGFKGLIIALIFAYVIGAFFMIIAMISGYVKKDDRIPFGLFLIPCAVGVWYAGETMLRILNLL